jgi:hypothetical protein
MTKLVVLSFDVYIDVTGEGVMNNTGDVSDAITNTDIPFSGSTTYVIDYNSLHIVE